MTPAPCPQNARRPALALAGVFWYVVLLYHGWRV